MELPVDTATLAAWSTLLGLTPEQTTEVTDDIEADLRRGYTFRPLALRHLSFEELAADMDTDELALMFLTAGLRKTGYPDAADQVLRRALHAPMFTPPTT